MAEMHFLVEETQDLPSDVLSPRFFMIHDTSTRSKDDVAELTRGQEFDDPFFEVTQLYVVSRTDCACLVDVELDYDLAIPVVNDIFEFANVAVENISMLRKTKRKTSWGHPRTCKIFAEKELLSRALKGQ